MSTEGSDRNTALKDLDSYIQSLNKKPARNGILTNESPEDILKDILLTFSYKTEFEIQHMFENKDFQQEVNSRLNNMFKEYLQKQRMKPDLKEKSNYMFNEYISYTRSAAWDKTKNPQIPRDVKSLIVNYIGFLNKLKLDENHPNKEDLDISQKFINMFLQKNHLLNEFDFLNFYLNKLFEQAKYEEKVQFDHFNSIISYNTNYILKLTYDDYISVFRPSDKDIQRVLGYRKETLKTYKELFEKNKANYDIEKKIPNEQNEFVNTNLKDYIQQFIDYAEKLPPGLDKYVEVEDVSSSTSNGGKSRRRTRKLNRRPRRRTAKRMMKRRRHRRTRK